ncbi:hypothetical protein HPT09_20650 [Pseudomonas aeruginosa]|nr:hypothetical protein HPT09_20650 [Pseudomonas aeruginosa]
MGNLSEIYNNQIRDNSVGGDLIIGGVVVKLPTFDIKMSAESLRRMIERHEKLKEDDPQYQYVLEELQSKIEHVEPRLVIGLESKLEMAGRSVYIPEALRFSQKAAKLITKFQHVRSYQIIFHHMLGLILTRFENQIRPLLAKGCDDLTVGAAINAIIIEPLYMEVSMVDGYINSEVVQGMLYFLTEKCHVEWR